MSPHAVLPAETEEDSSRSVHQSIVPQSNGVIVPTKSISGGSPKRRSHLRRTPSNELHDLICIGFGPASLATAVALHDALDHPTHLPTGTGVKSPKVCFLERQPQFAWHPGMLLPGAKMQISFLKDLATFRNPRSEFTFINYLYRKGRLAHFTNLSTFLPLRLEYEDYMRWCAEWFEEVTEYSQEAVEVRPEQKNDESAVETFLVRTRNLRTQKIETRRTRHVVIAVGGRPKIPDYLPSNHPQIIHSSQYARAVPALLKDPDHPYMIAVVGAGQSAAEVFSDLHSRFPNSKSTLIIRGSALKPSDDSPFVNEIFDPDRVDRVYHMTPETRKAAISEDRSTNYGVVRLELLEHLYADLYEQRLRYPNETEWPHRILTNRTVTGVDDLRPKSQQIRVRCEHQTSQEGKNCVSAAESLAVDALIVASGYERNIHEQLLQNARSLMPGGDTTGKKWTVGRDYRVDFEDGAVAENAGVWLQGCNESTHGLSDTLLSIVATRAGELVESIFGKVDA